MGDVDWSALEHNYGDASDVPGLLRACASPDAGTASDALADLTNKLYHQGGWVCSAAPAALPSLTDLVSDRAVHHRREVVELIRLLAGEAVTAAEKWVAPGWQRALDDARPRLLALLDDADPRVRRETTLLAAEGIRHPESELALRRRWERETDRTTRADLVLALGTVQTWAPTEALRAELVALLEDDDLHLRLAAVHALARSEPAIAASQVGMLVRAVLDPDAVLWLDSAWIGGTSATLVHTTGGLLASDPVADSVFAVGVARHGEADRRVAGLGHAQQVLSRWRTAVEGIRSLLGRGLDDDVPEVRYRAAALLACLGTEAAPYAEQLAARTADSALRDSRVRTTVGDAAVWALARQGHPDCRSGLVERLSGDRLGFDTVLAHYGREVPMLVQPAICEVLIPLREYSDVLIGPLAARRDLASNLCRVVAAWGPAAAVALPALLDAAAQDKLRPLAAKAIGAIGPAAAAAARTLRDSAAEPAVAWALWRTGADPDLGLHSLTRQLTQPRPGHVAIALSADLGSEAAACVDALRALTRSTEDWTRTEAAHALWRVTGDPAGAVTVLTELAEPLARGECLPAGIAALRYLADIGVVDGRVRAVAQAIADNPRRIACNGGWRTFSEDEQIRAAASALMD
ncbi:HEAT repeat domain-containing protein [Amycolatopsis camponoti]|nr:HEAT repeat domain-containing protein [Amycolatopsis camponoti]